MRAYPRELGVRVYKSIRRQEYTRWMRLDDCTYIRTIYPPYLHGPIIMLKKPNGMSKEGQRYCDCSKAKSLSG